MSSWKQAVLPQIIELYQLNAAAWKSKKNMFYCIYIIICQIKVLETLTMLIKPIIVSGAPSNMIKVGGGVNGVIFKTEETTYQAICL